MKKPIIVIPCNKIQRDGAPWHVVKQQYVRAVLELTDAIPLFIPAMGKAFDLSMIADRVDGILLTGAASNVCPTVYGAKLDFEKEYLDLDRDETTLPLIKAAIEMDMPLFAICRGFQEMNVACGGTLHQHVQDLPGKLDHRADDNLPLPEQYLQQKHKMHRQNGGIFERLGLPETFSTNSVHQQGVDKLGNGLHVEGISEDGLIEAFSVPGKRFILATQWHPEGDFWVNETSKTILKAFGEALK